jgi:hypothetical protein
MDVTADQVSVNFRFSENANDMAAVIEALKEKREQIRKVAEDAGLKMTETQITQLDVRQQRYNQQSGYNGSASFNVSIRRGIRPAGRCGPVKRALMPKALAACSSPCLKMGWKRQRSCLKTWRWKTPANRLNSKLPCAARRLAS